MPRNPALPNLTPEQRSAALKKGSANRKARADWLERIRTKDATVVDFLDAAENLAELPAGELHRLNVLAAPGVLDPSAAPKGLF